jgi:deoxycytidine triphosphate deaminase
MTAEQKYECYKKTDPFPEIAEALLNSADILDYVNTTGMIDPFYPADLKSASYAVRIKGVCVYWDKHGAKRETVLEQDHDTFNLEPNTIAFIEVEPMFRLPNYMALRFNLAITNVYRGLLLGTGPLVDPGYCGKIYIPLHNLTKNTYSFKCREPLIWMEFTKTSKIRYAPKVKKEDKVKRAGKYVEFPSNKFGLSLGYFLTKAYQGGKISSSLPEVVNKVNKSVGELDKFKADIKGTLNRWKIAGSVGFIIGVVAIAFPAWQLQFSYSENVGHVRENITDQGMAIKMLDERLGSLVSRNSYQHVLFEEEQKRVDRLRSQIVSLQEQVEIFRV